MQYHSTSNHGMLCSRSPLLISTTSAMVIACTAAPCVVFCGLMSGLDDLGMVVPLL